MKLTLIITFIIYTSNVFASDSTFFSCKYRYTFQKDSSNSTKKSNDIMILAIDSTSTVYYSLLKQLGTSNFEKKILDQKIQNEPLKIGPENANEGATFFIGSETEIIKINYAKGEIVATNKFLEDSYGYKENIEVPKWNIAADTLTILNQVCQKATTTYKGRNYEAWFALNIPISKGPWLLNGLPGLILKANDDKNQFAFECMELNISNDITNQFKPYTNTRYVSKSMYQEKKKLFAQNLVEYLKSNGISVKNTSGDQIVRPNKPYNPIDLSK